MANSKRKPGPLRGVGVWKNLETAGDCKRFFRWLILATKNGKLDLRTASILGQIGTYLLRAIEGSDLEQRLVSIEGRLKDFSSKEAVYGKPRIK